MERAVDLAVSLPRRLLLSAFTSDVTGMWPVHSSGNAVYSRSMPPVSTCRLL